MESLMIQGTACRCQQFLALCKLRVVSLVVFTAVIGMFLAVPGWPSWNALWAGTLGIALVAGAAAAFNCLIEQKIDAVMARTRARPLPRGELTRTQTLVFAGAVGGIGLYLLNVFVNPLTMWLTLATFVGYAVVYTVVLKPATPQNIVIGGASGAMPPVLGWAAATGEIHHDALLLFLIIFAWTPPHFWALAPPARAALHPAAVCRHHAAGWNRHGRLDLSARCGGAGRPLHPVRLAAIPPIQRCPGERDFPLFHLVFERVVRDHAGRPLFSNTHLIYMDN